MDGSTNGQAVVLKLCGTPTAATPYDGQYLKDFDFEAHGGVGLITMTPKVEEAKRFPDMVEALRYYRRSPECRPTRPDGEPNRPLTATNWSFERVA
jgi:hypothetical protein